MARIQQGTKPLRLEGLATPTAASDAATKAYVDAVETGIPTYANSTAYSVGDIVLYNNVLYRVNTAVANSNTSPPSSNSSFTSLTSTSGIETFANSTPYSAGEFVFDTGVQHLYYVQANVPSSNTTRPSQLPLNFVDLGYLSKQQADVLYLKRPSLGENLVADLSNASTIAARADATGTIRTNSFIDSSTPQLGFWPATYDFGNFPRSTDTFTARTSSTNWSDLFTGNYTNIAMNFGSARSNAFLQAFYDGHVGDNIIEIALRRDATNWSIWQLNGGYFGSEGNVVYFGHTSPTLVASQGSPGNANLQLYISLTTAGAYTAISTKITGENSVIGGDGIARQVGTGAIEDDAVTAAKLDTANTPANTEFMAYFGGEMTWVRGVEGVTQAQFRRDSKTGPNTDLTVGDGRFGLYSAVTNATSGVFLTASSNLSAATHVRLSTLAFTGEDLRAATGRLKQGSIVNLGRDSSNFITVRLGAQISGTNIRAIDAILEQAGTYGNDSTNWSVNIRSSSFNLTVSEDFVPGAVNTAAIADDAVTGPKIDYSGTRSSTNRYLTIDSSGNVALDTAGSASIPDNSITGSQLNVTDVSTGTTTVLSVDNGRINSGPYATFSGGRDGIIPGPTASVRPTQENLQNAIQTQPLRFTTNTQGIITGARGWELLHNGSVVTTRPTTWAAFDHSSDDVGMWITTEDLTRLERDRLTAYGATLDTGTIEMLVVNADDHNSWMICSMQADLSESGDDTLETGDLGTGMYVSVGDGAFSVLSSQGVPSDNLKFYFPVTLTGTIDLSETTPSTDRFIDAAGNWVEPALNSLDTLSMVLETQVTPYRLVGYDTSSPTLKYKQWDTKVDGYIYHFTVFYAFTSGVIQTATVYQGHWDTVPTGDNASSFLFGTRTYTTTSGVTTWTDSI